MTKKIYRELAVDVVELVFIFAIVLIQVFFINVTKIVKIVRTFGIYTFMDNEIFPVFFRNKGISTVWATELYRGKTTIFRRKFGIADLTENLAFGTVVFV